MWPALLCVLATTVAAGSVGFVSIGDWGGSSVDAEHADNQNTVAASLALTAESINASFVIGTGDNFYYYGVHNLSDSQFLTDFEQPYNYASLMVPWLQCLGNHDYGYDVDAQVQYKSPKNDRWVMPARYYSTRLPLTTTDSVTIIVIDSSPCVQDYRDDNPDNWDPCGTGHHSPSDCQFHQNILAQSCADQLLWLQDQIARIPDSDWRVLVAHHPLDEIDAEADFISTVQNAGFDLYINGHTHALQHYTIDDQGAYVLTGAGSMVDTQDQHMHNAHNRPLSKSHTVTSVWYQKTAGYTSHVFSKDLSSLVTTFYGSDGSELYSFSVDRGHGTTKTKE